jgi:hypothetical protein
MSIRARTTLPAALVLIVLAMLATAQGGSASHPRPLAASPTQVALVPAYNQCTAANRTHGPPLDYPACNPPAQSSTSVTVGTTDANGANPNSTGSIRVAAAVGSPGPPDDSDVRIVANITDVRCKVGTSACGSSNTQAGPDYTGELQVSLVIRIADHWNAVAAGGGSDPATVIDVPLLANINCAASASADVGGTCMLNTTVNTLYQAAAVKDGKRMVVALEQPQVRDGGSDGIMGTAPNRLFAVQGIFVP